MFNNICNSGINLFNSYNSLKLIASNFCLNVFYFLGHSDFHCIQIYTVSAC